MAHAKQNGHPDSLRQNLVDVVHDVWDLAELQWELLNIDAAEARRLATMPIIALVIAAAVLLGSVPVLLLGLAELLVAHANFAPAWAYLLVVVVAICLCAIAAKLAFDRLRRSAEVFERSRDEFKQNVKWIRRVIKAQGRAERMGRISSQSKC